MLSTLFINKVVKTIDKMQFMCYPITLEYTMKLKTYYISKNILLKDLYVTI